MPQLLLIVGPDSPENRSIIAVQKARLKDQHLACEFTEQRSEDAPARSFALICQEQVHPDLLHTFSRLVPHLCLLTEQLTEDADYWPGAGEELPARFAAFTVTGFSLGKNQAGVTLVGQRELTGGRVLNLTTSYLLFEDEHSAYPYTGLLEADVQTALTEVEAALRGKCTDYRQLDLFEYPKSSREEFIVVPMRPMA
ncbi:hypothetical protein [Hymenobacter baengnokdamensis]|uniref:hypothetical protein n=1 Tax=Hymenobacter baengnokdamensis TaxID=2615203 RepID=UPI001245EDC8|nr:hypothetical protein [Hymenobacter baengnokdamensis]